MHLPGDDKIFYDYADVAVNLMPVEIREQLKYGLYITGEQELTNFYRPTVVKYCAETIRLIKYDTRFRQMSCFCQHILKHILNNRD